MGVVNKQFMPIPRSLEGRTAPVHPGELLREDFMKPLGLSAAALAKALHVPARRVSEIVREQRGLSGEMVLRLARYFRMSSQFWMRMQTQYDLDVAVDSLAATIRREVRPAPRNRTTGELKPVTTA
jgi:antitoxin HigA-1